MPVLRTLARSAWKQRRAVPERPSAVVLHRPVAAPLAVAPSRRTAVAVGPPRTAAAAPRTDPRGTAAAGWSASRMAASAAVVALSAAVAPCRTVGGNCMHLEQLLLTFTRFYSSVLAQYSKMV